MFQDWGSCLDLGGGQIPTIQCIFPLFHNIITAALIFGAVVALFFIIFGGIKLLRSQGDQKQVQGARQTITYAIIGLVVVFLSFFIINAIATITGTECIKDFNSFTACQDK